jgi:hypothetical protein
LHNRCARRPIPRAMTIAPPAHLEAFYTALWIGALLFAVDAIADPFPAEFDQLASVYFERFPPVAKA